MLRQVLQINTCLWGGIYNYLLPVPARKPLRYRDYYFQDAGAHKRVFIKGTGPSAKEFIDGLLEAFQPDLCIETKPKLADKIRFDKGRIIRLDQFNEADENGQRKYGIDLTSICRALYDSTFRFVLRHPPRVIEP